MEIDKILHSIYYDPRHPGGFSSINKLYGYAKEILPKVKVDDVKNWLKKQLTYTLHRPARRRWPRNRIQVYAPNELYQADLTFLDKFSRQNKGFKYILTMIDCFSKFAFAMPLKTKTPTEVKNVLEKIFARKKPINLQTDKGKEFDNRIIRSFLKENDVNYYTTNSPNIKCAVVERFNRTLKNKMYKLFTTNGNYVWYNKLDALLESYNNTIHTSTKFKPVEVSYKNAHHVYKNLYKKTHSDAVPKFKQGETVRVSYDTKPLDRGFHPNWKDKIETVESHIRGEKELYKLKSNPKRRFYKEELQSVTPDFYRIEKIIKSKRQRGKEYLLVKWKGYDNTENSWIPKEEVKSLMELHSITARGSSS